MYKQFLLLYAIQIVYTEYNIQQKQEQYEM